MATWSVGSISVTRVDEQIGFSSLPPQQFLSASIANCWRGIMSWLVPNHYSPEQDRLITSVHSWLMRTGERTILLDCCAGNHKVRPGFARFHQLSTPWLERLLKPALRPEDIDIVLCTHLHSDHVGWNTMLRDGRWVPTFPNAKYLFSRTENEHGDPRRNPAADADLQRSNAYRDSVLPVIEAGQVELIEGSHAIGDSLAYRARARAHARPYDAQARRRGEQAVLCGDAIHHPLQVYAPHWNSGFCEFPRRPAPPAAACWSIVPRAALLFPIHFGAPHVAAIASAGDAFSLGFVNAERG